MLRAYKAGKVLRRDASLFEAVQVNVSLLPFQVLQVGWKFLLAHLQPQQGVAVPVDHNALSMQGCCIHRVSSLCGSNVVGQRSASDK